MMALTLQRPDAEARVLNALESLSRVCQGSSLDLPPGGVPLSLHCAFSGSGACFNCGAACWLHLNMFCFGPSHEKHVLQRRTVSKVPRTPSWQRPASMQSGNLLMFVSQLGACLAIDNPRVKLPYPGWKRWPEEVLSVPQEMPC